MSDDDKSRDAIYIDALHELANEQADCIAKLGAENAGLRSQINTVQIAAKYAAKIRDERIEKLKAALREIDIACDYSGSEYVCRGIAREALDAK